MVLCDNLHVDATTGKRTILGTFSTVGAQEFPAKLRFVVYFAITDAEGEWELVFRMVDSSHAFEDGVPPIFEFPIPINSPNPLAVLEGQIHVGGEIPKPGVYHCELLCNGNVLMSRRLIAIRPSDLQGET